MSAQPRYASPPPNRSVERCLDCGAMVYSEDKPAHTRFHSILGAHAWALAVLKTSHLAAHVHDKYDVAGRIDSRKFDSWSGDALAEVMKAIGEEPAP